LSVGGTGYGRVDIRMLTNDTGAPLINPITLLPDVYVLEFNPLCGLSEDEETSLGQIVRLSGSTVKQFVSHVLSVGLSKHNQQHTQHHN